MPRVRRPLLIMFLLLAWMVLGGPRGEGNVASPGSNRITIAFIGDLALAGTAGLDDLPPSLAQQLRSADVGVANLETTFHRWTLPPAAESGGTYLCADPMVAEKLAHQGIGLVARANNHAADFGQAGINATTEVLLRAGIASAGVGAGLAAARKPARIQVSGVPVALFSVTTSYPASATASPDSPGITPRVGVNPWPLAQVVALRPDRWALLASLLTDLRPPAQLNGGRITWGGVSFEKAPRPGRRWELDEDGVRALETAVRLEDDGGALVLVSIHCHQWDSDPLEPPASVRAATFRLAKAGARVVFVHGTHLIRGIRILDGSVVFEGLGTFDDQTGLVHRQPSEAFTSRGLDPSAPLSELLRRTRHLSGADHPLGGEALLCTVSFQGRSPRRLVIQPVETDAGFGGTGTPHPVKPSRVAEVLHRVQRLSQLDGDRWHAERGLATIELPSPTSPGRGPLQ